MNKLSYVKLQPFKSYTTKDKLTNQQRFWKKYQNNAIDTYKNTITAISSNHNIQNIVLYAEARSLRIYDTQKQLIVKEIHSFNQTLTALCIRPDSAVMAIGDESGTIEVMDTKQKFHLRTFKQHKKRVNALQYIQNALYSGGDDFIVRHFDVAGGDVVHSYQNAHSDYIKSIKAVQNNHILTAGYDGYIRLFDFRVHEAAQIQFHHRQPLECIDISPSKLNFIAAGGNKVSLWDIRTGKQLFSAENNKKIVSGVKYASNGSRFITTSFDHYLKVYKTDTFQLTYQDKLASPIHTFDLTNDELHLLLGLEGGKLISKSRKGKPENEDETDEQKQAQDQIIQWMKKNEEKKFAYNDQYFYRGVYQKASNFDIKFEQNQSRKISKYDVLLKKFQYKEALLMAIEKKNMMIYLSLVDEYIQRGCLQRAINAFTEDQIQRLLSMMLPLIHNIKYSKPSLLILQKLIFFHKQRYLPTPKILEEVSCELQLIDKLVELQGMLELLQFNFQ